jgi:hypothetical protein
VHGNVHGNVDFYIYNPASSPSLDFMVDHHKIKLKWILMVRDGDWLAGRCDV